MQNTNEASPPTPTDPTQGSGASETQNPRPEQPKAAPAAQAPDAQQASAAQPVGSHQAPGQPAAGYSTASYPTSGYSTDPYAGTPYAQNPGAPYAGQYATAGAAQPGTTGAWATAGSATEAPGYPAGGYGQLPSAPMAAAPGSTGGYPPARRLTRSQDDRVVAGVLGGLARYWNTDPLLLRILTIVLTIATGGALLLGYIIAWIVIPLEPTTPSGWPAGTGYAAGGNPAYGSAGTSNPGTPYESTPRPPRSYLGWLVVSVGLILAGVLAVIGLLVEPTSGFAAFVCAVVLIVLGAGLIAGAWYGRARWLTILAIPMVFITMAAVAANSWVQSPSADRWITSPDGGISVGSRVWTVTQDDLDSQPLEYRVTAGDAQLDLTGLTAINDSEPGAPRQRVTINAGVGLGELVVRIPADMHVNLAATVRAGAVSVPGSLPGQVNPQRSGTDLNVNTTIESVTEGQPAYVVDLDVAIGAGNLEVLREAA